MPEKSGFLWFCQGKTGYTVPSLVYKYYITAGPIPQEETGKSEGGKMPEKIFCFRRNLFYFSGLKSRKALAISGKL